ncbi:hypothetical protein EVAR_23784_1 [Eumeta japonica]|uniref:Winged helix-turn-helix domain-containing protein n=1 Tax=Eumeta variegata TaxID=151549 RepID=A0A4C1VNH0_EUMVA|nr:hypothetical protein EVAR_23784_1 [Eumeta japonica]
MRIPHWSLLVAHFPSFTPQPPSNSPFAFSSVHSLLHQISHSYPRENGVTEPCHAQLVFRVYLVSGATGSHTREARSLRFWFKPQLPPDERAHEAQTFFRELVSPQDFPKDYVGFIKKIMKLMQHKYQELKILEVELRQEGCGPPPQEFIEETTANHAPVISEQRVLDMIENAYPNPLTVDDFVNAGKWAKAEVKEALEALEEKGLTRAMSDGLYIRQHSVDTQVVKQMPTLSSSRQPTIAIITALYCEKQAVDAMMDNQETFVRFTTVGYIELGWGRTSLYYSVSQTVGPDPEGNRKALLRAVAEKGKRQVFLGPALQ